MGSVEKYSVDTCGVEAYSVETSCVETRRTRDDKC